MGISSRNLYNPMEKKRPLEESHKWLWKKEGEMGEREERERERERVSVCVVCDLLLYCIWSKCSAFFYFNLMFFFFLKDFNSFLLECKISRKKNFFFFLFNPQKGARGRSRTWNNIIAYILLTIDYSSFSVCKFSKPIKLSVRKKKKKPMKNKTTDLKWNLSFFYWFKIFS